MFFGCIKVNSFHSEEYATLKKNSQYESSNLEDFSFQNISVSLIQHEKFSAHSKFSYYQNESHLVLLFGTVYESKFDSKQETFLKFILEEFNSNNEHFMDALNGDFVLIFQEFKTNNFRIYRDHVGILPFFYLQHDAGFYFSSDQLSLTKTFCSEQIQNNNYFLKGLKFVDFNITSNKQIHKIKGGSYIEFSSSKIKEIKYWFPEKTKQKRFKNEEELLQELKAQVEKAVEIRCDESYSASAHLSGGLDSSLVCVLARKHFKSQKDFFGLSLSPDEVDTSNLILDERNIIQEIARENDIKPIFIQTNKINEAQENPIYFPFFGAFDEEINLDFASQNGINLIFSGWGGDDFLSISNKGMELDLLLALKFKTLIDKQDLKRIVKTLKRLAKNAILPLFGIVKRRYKHYANEYNIYLKKEFHQNDKKVLKTLYTYHSRKEIHLNALKLGHLSDRTEIVYNIGERRGVEYRYPLLDKNLIEFILSIPTKWMYKRKESRFVMRAICKDFLPESAYNKTDKTDFTIEKYFSALCRSNAIKNSEELEQFKKNEYLYFFEFNKIEKDIKTIDTVNSEEENERLFDVLNHIKTLDDFFKKMTE